MKRFFLIITLLLMVTAAWGQEPQTLARQADELYRHGEYDSALALYQSALDMGYTSAELHYNMGNTHYRLEHLGQAILHYERALRLKPSMKEAKENLALANSKTQDRIVELPRLFLVNWYHALCTHLTPKTWRVIWLVLFALLAAAVATFMLSRELPLRKATFSLAIAAGVLLLLSTVLLISSTRHYNAHAEAIVIDEAIAVRNSPEQQSLEKLILHEGTKVTVSESLAGWEKITLADGTTGWCESHNIERI